MMSIFTLYFCLKSVVTLFLRLVMSVGYRYGGTVFIYVLCRSHSVLHCTEPLCVALKDCLCMDSRLMNTILSYIAVLRRNETCLREMQLWKNHIKLDRELQDVVSTVLTTRRLLVSTPIEDLLYQHRLSAISCALVSAVVYRGDNLHHVRICN